MRCIHMASERKWVMPRGHLFNMLQKRKAFVSWGGSEVMGSFEWAFGSFILAIYSDRRVEIVATSNLYEKFDFWPTSSSALLRLNFWKPKMFLPKLLCAKIKSNNHKK